jgi:hypothetical protein
MNMKDLKFRAVIHLGKRQDIHQCAENLYRKNFDNSYKIQIREQFKEDGKTVYCVSDIDGIEPLYLIQ